MKVLTFSTLYPHAARPSHGIFVETRLRHLVASGQVESTVVAPVPWFPFAHRAFGEYAVHARAPRAEVRSGIEVLHPRFPAVPKLGMTVSPFLLSRAVAPTLRRLLDGRAFDLIDAHYFYPDGVAAVMLGRRLHRPVVVTARGTDINLIAQYGLPRRMIQWAAHHAAGVITVSRALKDALVALGVPAHRVQVLRNGVDVDLFRPLEQTKSVAAQRKTLLSVGNLLEFKGHGIVIQALACLPDCELVIIGHGPDRPVFEELAREAQVSERVRFTGPLSQRELREHYARAHALILASSREGWPNVLLEAMACGTPVVAADVGGVGEIVTSADAGVVVRERSPAAMAQGIRRLFANYPDPAATRRYAERFGWGATTRGQLRLFRQLLAAG